MEWQFSNIAPGTYTFGTAPFTGMPSDLGRAPFVHVQLNNEGEYFQETVSATGLVLRDRFTGPEPVMTVTIIER